MIGHSFKLLAAVGTSCTINSVGGSNYCTGLPEATASGANLQHLLQIVIGILAAIAVLIIVIAALNFVTSGGDAAKAAKARTTIIYALVGLAVTVMSEAIVTFVVGRL